MAPASPSRLAALAAAAAALFPSTAALAQEFQPYPTPQVTTEQWQRYLAVVQAQHGGSMEVYKDKGLVVFSDASTRTFYIFTTRDHPAHPAWITRQLVEKDGQVNVRQIGYFAGRQEPFDVLFREYLQRNEDLKDEVGKRNQ
jgi:hypothetical protein